MGKQLKFLFLATLATLMVLAGSLLQIGEPLMASPSAVAIANQLYTQYPELPRVEQSHTTLLSRFIEYHLDAKARPAQYHLDWELSMADYVSLGMGDTASAMDRQAMQTLSRQQRHQLVSALEQTFTR